MKEGQDESYNISQSSTEGSQAGPALWRFEELLEEPSMICPFERLVDERELVVCLVEVALAGERLLCFFPPMRSTSPAEVVTLLPRKEPEREDSPLP